VPPEPPFAGMKFARYELIERLGAGGMGEVYRARDVELSRHVGIKFLPAEYASDPDRLARFSQEARALSSLNHPNIVTIHEVGEVSGLPYIVMELVEGETLRRFLRRRPVPTRQALDIAAQTADGLSKAHSAGIVHRDLKPENIMVTEDGRAKILDFGLAKLALAHKANAVEEPEKSGEAETRTVFHTSKDTILGTTDYMSPEQALGRPVDYRSDQFALGSILWEMASGRQPFHRDSAAQTRAAIIEDEPEPVERHNPSWPVPARWIIQRCLDKDPAARYVSTLDLARDLRTVKDRLSEASNSDAGARERRPPRQRAHLLYAIAVLVALLAAPFLLPGVRVAVWEWLHPLPAEKSIAVLPVRCLGGSQEDDAVCDGMLDYTIARLGEMERYQEKVWVVPASDVRQSGIATAETAWRVLGASLAVNITVQRVGDRMLVSVGLMDTERRLQVRAATADVDPRVTSVLDRTVDLVVGMLDIESGPAAQSNLRRGGTGVVQASELYAQGLAKRPYQQGLTALARYEQQPNLERATGLFNEALALDPQYALAHAGLCETYVRLYRVTKRPEHVTLAERHCHRALEIDDLSGAAWVTLGIFHVETGKPEEALTAFRKALDRNPRNGVALRELAVAYEHLRRYDEAEAAYREAVELMPDSWAGHSHLGAFLNRNNRAREAEEVYLRALLIAPDNARLWSNLGAAYFLQEKYGQAESAFSKSIDLHPTATAFSNLATLYFFQGAYTAAARTLERATEVNERDYRVWRNLAAAYYWAPGERDRAGSACVRALDLARQEREVDPKNAFLLVAAADCNAIIGNGEAARSLVEDGLALAASNAIEIFKVAAGVYEMLGDRETALLWIGRALREGYPPDRIQRDPSLAGIRGDPRYASLGK
jgi:tetratricopeptide (TPR) repeat protein/TolB-like protein